MHHDARFKQLLKEFFTDFMQLFFADWLDEIDLSELTWLEQEIAVDPIEGTRQFVDLLVRTRTRNPIPGWPISEGNPCVLAILIEIESQDSTSSIRERMPDYVWRLSRKLGHPVFPIILFLQVGLDGLHKIVHEVRLKELVLEHSEFLYVGLPALDALEYINGDNWLGVALSALMRIPKDRVASLGAEAFRRINESPLTDQQKFLLGDCVEAYLPLTSEQKAELDGILQTERYREIQRMNVTTYERGMQQGQVQGMQKLLTRFIEMTFGQVNPAIQAEMSRLSTPQEIELASAALKAATSEDDYLDRLRHIST